MILDLPFWFRQRQAQVEELSTGRFKLSGPNLPEAVIAVRIGENLKWQSTLQTKSDVPEIAKTEFEFKNPRDALAAAFELYREQFVV
jgi:hypothetical protein